MRSLVLAASVVLLAGCGGAAEGDSRQPETARTESGAATVTEPPIVRRIRLPEGFRANLYATDIKGVRWLAFSGSGLLAASVPNENRVLALPDEDGDGRADRKVVFHEGIRSAHGLAWHRGWLYVAGTGSLWRLRDTDGDLVADKEEKLSEDLPPGGGHWTRTLAIGPGPGGDPHLYVSVGSTCNICIEEDPRRATVLRFPLEGGSAHIFATGLRNSVGLAWRPGTDELWGTDNGRDRLGDDLPPDELNHIREGRFYGWPFWYGENERDPEHGRLPPHARDPEPSRWEFQAHSAALGIEFYTGGMFPAPYRGDAFVAFHGSWNRSVPTGYKVVRIHFEEGRPVEESDFLTGLLDLEPRVRKHGRPVCPVTAPDGALLVSDDAFGRIYRVTWSGGPEAASP